MALRRIKCRIHDGIFAIHPKRGRQPVSCKPEYPCDRADTETPKEMKERTSPIGIPEFVPANEKPALERVRQRLAEAAKATNPSLPLAKVAKERLTAVGWVVQGRGWLEDNDGMHRPVGMAEITASRDHETLIIQWRDGDLVSQTYAMEFVKPSQNNYPENDLHFNPNELSDSELVRMIKGMKVTWWNTIAGAKESAIAGGNITVEHIFFANGNEDDSKRIVKFVDRDAGGFRAFHVSALLKVG